MRTLVFLILAVFLSNTLVSVAFGAQAPYCLALRGNGEAQPAHWGALARTVEQMGLPQMMSGGSSATISMFLLESMAANPFVLNKDKTLQKQRVSLMLKSLLGFVSIVQNSPEFRDFMALYGKIQSAPKNELSKTLQDLIEKKNWSTAQKTLKQAYQTGLIDTEYASLLLKATAEQDLKKSRFYLAELQETLRVFGSFNAASDQNLFFRPGVVSFEKLASSFGRVAHFYSTLGSDEALKGEWQTFFETCAPESVGKSWLELISEKPVCGQLFGQLYTSHFTRNQPEIPMEEMPVGYVIPTLPTTSVLVKSAAAQATQAMKQYHTKLDPAFGASFKLENTEDVRFGYWGSAEILERIEKNLDGRDEKSRRFYKLGAAPWKEVLSLSPAEPGLSRMKTFTNQGETLVSAGGWSDLHPVLVLKAAGCENVIYVSRQGGDSIFGQGVAKRLLNLDRDWSLLETSTPEASKRNGALNNQGDPSDQSSLWSRLYNLGNKSSSYNESLRQASAILCTNWNAFDVKTQLVELIEDSYRSSFRIQSSRLNGLSPVLTEERAGCQAL